MGPTVYVVVRYCRYEGASPAAFEPLSHSKAMATDYNQSALEYKRAKLRPGGLVSSERA